MASPESTECHDVQGGPGRGNGGAAVYAGSPSGEDVAQNRERSVAGLENDAEGSVVRLDAAQEIGIDNSGSGSNQRDGEQARRHSEQSTIVAEDAGCSGEDFHGGIAAVVFDQVSADADDLTAGGKCREDAGSHHAHSVIEAGDEGEEDAGGRRGSGGTGHRGGDDDRAPD